MAEVRAYIMEAEQKAGRKLVTVGFMCCFDSSYREMKAILDISESGAVWPNDQELSPCADFHEWHHYPKADGMEVTEQSLIFPRNWLNQHVSALPLKPVEPARERQRTAESKPPVAEIDPTPAPRHGHHSLDTASSEKNRAGLGTWEIIQPARLRVGGSPRETREGWCMEGLIITVGAGIVVVVGNALAPKLRLLVPLTQILLGFALAPVSGLENLHMSPEVMLLLFLPGLLFWESLTTSKNTIQRDLRGVPITPTVFVVATTFAVAWIASPLGISWETALILGVTVAPPDATAAAALAKGLPRRQFTLLKTESLANDGTALVVYTIAVGLAFGGQYTPWDITRMTMVSFFGGILVGIVTAVAAYPTFHRLHEPITINMALLVIPYAAYLAVGLVHAFGVLMAAVAGLIISTLSNQFSTPELRTQVEHLWSLATSLLNGALFLLIGIEARLLVANSSFPELLMPAGIAVGVAVTLVVSRFVFLQITVMIIRTLDRRPEQRQRRLSYRARVVNAISAPRGGASPAVVLSIPLVMKDDSPFPYRDEVVLVVAPAAVIEMAVQGLLPPKVIARAAKGGHIGDDEEVELTEEQLTTERRLAILEAAHPELPILAEQAGAPPRVAEAMKERLDDIAAYIGVDDEEGDVAEIVVLERLHGVILRRKRELLGRFVRERRISDETARILRARMDPEEIHRNGCLSYE